MWNTEETNLKARTKHQVCLGGEGPNSAHLLPRAPERAEEEPGWVSESDFESSPRSVWQGRVMLWKRCTLAYVGHGVAVCRCGN